MIHNSIIISYKTKQFTLDRVNAEGKLFQIGFASDKWGVRIYGLERKQIRIIIEKSVRKEDGTSTQFLWDCYCTPFPSGLSLDLVCDPATCKRISRMTKWLIVCPMLDEIYGQLKAEIDALYACSEG